MNVDEFECSTCAKTFKSRKGLIIHIKKTCSTNQEKKNVSSKKVHQCSLCAMTFLSISGLWYHMNHTHVGSCPLFECQYCKKKCRSSNALNNHLLLNHATSETNSMLKKCYICPAKFKSASARIYHFKKMHKQEYLSYETDLKSRKVFKCTFCYKCFAQKYYRKNHEIVCKERNRESNSQSNTNTISFSKCKGDQNVENILAEDEQNKLHNLKEDKDLKNVSIHSNDVDTDITPSLHRYFNDQPPFMQLRTPDMATLCRQKLNIKYGQKTVYKYKKKIVDLQQQICYLKEKFKTLNDIINQNRN